MMDNLGRHSKRLGPLLIGVVLLLIAATGFYQVEPGEIAVIRTLGKETGRSGPGLHFRVPVIQLKDTVNVSEIRRIEVGFRGDTPMPAEAQMLTGDENIVEAHLIVQYRIADPSKYLFRLANPEDTLRFTAEVALRSVIGRTTIDDAITKGRGKVQQESRERLQDLMDKYQSGLFITEVKLQSVDPPEQVKDAFHEVVRAREQKEQLINQAKGYSEDLIPRARGEAEKQIRDAEAYKEQRILRAQGDAKKFDQVYFEYEKAKDVTRQRMYLETMERVLGKVESKTIVDGNLPGSTLPVLQLGREAVASGATATPPTNAAAGGRK
jgi:membrane protease subunit HflK